VTSPKPNTTTPIFILGAGMVGTCTALHLQQRGFDVTLIDRRPPGQETSFGNAGLIQGESVEPYPFPRDPGFLLDVALGRGAEVHWHLRGLWQMAGPLLRYFRHSHPQAHAAATQHYSRLIAHATAEHAPLIAAAGAEDLVVREGFRFGFRTARAFDEGVQRARALEAGFGVRHRVEDGAALAKAEPALRQTLAGAVHWLDPGACQGSCRVSHAATALISAAAASTAAATHSRSGLSVTAPIGDQSRVLPDQRFGFA
jgi:D-amino-acid dehydrogenase